MAYIPQQILGITRFDEVKTALRTSQINFKPTWGVSSLRYATVTTGTGAAVGETGGEFRLQSGTANNGLCSVRTNQRGQYQAGTMGQAGIGVRVPTAPTGTEFFEWGYTDFSQSGFHLGVDATGKYIAYTFNAVTTKIYQTSWNVDKLDGSGTSGLTLDLAKGVISQIEFTWYGYGDIAFIYYPYNATTKQIQRVVVYELKIDNQTSIDDPNQPLMFRASNGASGTTNKSLYIGGHQFSIIDGNSFPQNRLVSELVSSYVTALNTNWQPILAMRKKATFGDSGRANSVRTIFSNYEVAADDNLEVRLTVGGITNNLTWGTPTGWTATETAAETKKTGGTALTTSSNGLPFDYSFVTSTAKSTNIAIQNTDIALGSDQEIILWIRRQSASGAITVRFAHITWTEQW